MDPRAHLTRLGRLLYKTGAYSNIWPQELSTEVRKEGQLLCWCPWLTPLPSDHIFMRFICWELHSWLWILNWFGSLWVKKRLDVKVKTGLLPPSPNTWFSFLWWCKNVSHFNKYLSYCDTFLYINRYMTLHFNTKLFNFHTEMSFYFAKSKKTQISLLHATCSAANSRQTQVKTNWWT